MVDEIERAIDSIPKIATKQASKQDEEMAILNLEDLMTEKPRASVKEIDGTHRLIKMIDNKKRYTYKSKNSSSK
ncbi:MAG: hypothetical protein H7647_12195 [Candidatus Heimdallarchaeota archaeon]|nr:hypothetical protein [Candidatus Heimdallarchaeota archaeon]MCK4255186.1 hypothetical protein [Candidatus Heimdallarchaeota archaeon]